MESHLNENFGGVKPKHSSDEALERWRKVVGVVKNPKRRFRFSANLSKRSEAAQMMRSNQVTTIDGHSLSSSPDSFTPPTWPSAFAWASEHSASPALSTASSSSFASARGSWSSPGSSHGSSARGLTSVPAGSLDIEAAPRADGIRRLLPTTGWNLFWFFAAMVLLFHALLILWSLVVKELILKNVVHRRRLYQGLLLGMGWLVLFTAYARVKLLVETRCRPERVPASMAGFMYTVLHAFAFTVLYTIQYVDESLLYEIIAHVSCFLIEVLGTALIYCVLHVLVLLDGPEL